MKSARDLAVLLLLSSSELLKPAKADQPVHCLRENMYGVWDFHVSSDSHTVNLFEQREVCTHQIPNGLQFVNKDYNFQFQNYKVWRVDLQDGFKVQAMECSNKPKDKGEACDSKTIVGGKWSPIYSQALLVELDNGKRFISNFRYNLKDSVVKNPLEDDITKLGELSTGSEEAFDSDCSSTMIGYVQDDFMSTKTSTESMKNFKATCFFGRQVEHFNIETTKPIEEGEKKLKFNKILTHNSAASLDLGKINQAA